MRSRPDPTWTASPLPPEFEAERIACPGAEPIRTEPDPRDGLPLCSMHDCPQFDGKRCLLTGEQPFDLCRPALWRIRVGLGPTMFESVDPRPTGVPLPVDVLTELRAFIAGARREDGDGSANDPDRYRLVLPGIVWGPGGVLVLTADGWSWADDLDDPDSYYTDQYRREFP